MGVKGLTALLKRMAPNSVTLQHISNYKGKTLAIDVSCFLNRFIYGLDPHPARVQRGVYRLCMYLHLNGINPIFVFDGEGRIIEKHRETLKRAAMKEKVERAFRLEKNRKTRLKGLRGSTQLLQTISPEQLSSILEGVRTHENLVTTATATGSGKPVATEGEIAKTTSDQKKALDMSQLHAPLALDLLDDVYNIHEDSLEYESLRHIPSISDYEQRQLDNHLRLINGLYTQSGPIPQDSAVGDDLEFDVSEHDLEAIGRLELDLETVGDLDLINELSHSNDMQLKLRTGTSIQSLIPAGDLPKVENVGSPNRGRDAKIREKVRSALTDFVQTVESDVKSSMVELQESGTRRQKALGVLEQKLAKGIKRALRINVDERMAQKNTSSPTKRSLAESAVLEAKQAVTSKIPPTALLSQPSIVSEDVFLSTSSIPSDSATSKASENEVFEADGSGLLDGASFKTMDEAPPNDIMDCIQDQLMSDNMSNRIRDERLVDDMTDKIDALDEDDLNAEAGTETEQDPGLHSMIQDILSEHESLFVTLERRTLRITRPLVLSCQELLRAMGQPVIEAYEAEAEAVCARLTTLGWADASVSEDTDTAVFGNGILLRQIGASNDRDIIEIDPLQAHSGLGLSRNAFRDMCILCGTDFSGTIEGIGPNRAVKLMQYYGSIESIMANVSYKPRPDFVYDRARRVFDRTPVVSEDPNAYLPSPENEPLLQELLSKYDIDPEEIERELLKDMHVKELDTPSTGAQRLGDPFSTDPFGVDPFMVSVIRIPEPDDNKGQ
ncbi:hypothetical protein BC939DRAFT_139791 [Gamsiella multidivaricata]|uniref:uncharacterized protein n=1 Tax=Gamsiella multidivaricata TaxID=101098 RepID=UPI00221FFC40|nr:uncharacterized protein BC939DRAFT_139791 [Gamsiella multidivaricata]KAG0371414.1 Flap endonuclease GEN 1 [Gamsiella multidivaricata]KAI7824712.1 hypothetical protein BC939DRAFT_139791 [Gamsiella multidivaricata]